jgi:hypothetical protein
MRDESRERGRKEGRREQTTTSQKQKIYLRSFKKLNSRNRSEKIANLRPCLLPAYATATAELRLEFLDVETK